jgi:hypothetical protein
MALHGIRWGPSSETVDGDEWKPDGKGWKRLEKAGKRGSRGGPEDRREGGAPLAAQ